MQAEQPIPEQEVAEEVVVVDDDLTEWEVVGPSTSNNVPVCSPRNQHPFPSLKYVEELPGHNSPLGRFIRCHGGLSSLYRMNSHYVQREDAVMLEALEFPDHYHEYPTQSPRKTGKSRRIRNHDGEPAPRQQFSFSYADTPAWTWAKEQLGPKMVGHWIGGNPSAAGKCTVTTATSPSKRRKNIDTHQPASTDDLRTQPMPHLHREVNAEEVLEHHGGISDHMEEEVKEEDDRIITNGQTVDHGPDSHFGHRIEQMAPIPEHHIDIARPASDPRGPAFHDEVDPIAAATERRNLRERERRAKAEREERKQAVQRAREAETAASLRAAEEARRASEDDSSVNPELAEKRRLHRDYMRARRELMRRSGEGYEEAVKAARRSYIERCKSDPEWRAKERQRSRDKSRVARSFLSVEERAKRNAQQRERNRCRRQRLSSDDFNHVETSVQEE